MAYSVLLTIAAVDGIVFGLALLVVPDVLLGVFGARLDALAQLAFRQVGAAVLGLGVVDGLGRNVQDGEARRAILGGNLVSFVPIDCVRGRDGHHERVRVGGRGVPRPDGRPLRVAPVPEAFGARASPERPVTSKRETYPAAPCR